MNFDLIKNPFQGEIGKNFIQVISFQMSSFHLFHINGF